MVRRVAHIPLSHRLSRVRPNPSGSHRSQGCHQKKDSVEGILSENIEEMKAKNLDLETVSSAARAVDDQDAVVERIKTLKDKKVARESTLMNADKFLRYVLLCSMSGDPNMRTSSWDSDVVIGLEIWRQMVVTYAGSAQTRVVTLLKQITTPTEWNPEKKQRMFFRCVSIGSNSSASTN